MINGKYVIGVLGGVGSGKSTLLNYIVSRYSAKHIPADDVGRELMKPGRSVYYALREVYGNAVLDEDGLIDVHKLSAIVYESPESQKKVNGIEHPLIKSEIIERIAGCPEDVVFVEAALLIEGNLKEICDEIWMISADKEVRIARLMADRRYPREKCERIIALQMSEDEMKKHAQIRIDNSGSLNDTLDLIDHHMGVLSQDLKKDLERH